MKKIALALMEAASFCAGVRRKRYSAQQETAQKKTKLSLKEKISFSYYF
nr:hypothetical protein [uncultured Flavobacterium sp.]